MPRAPINRSPEGYERRLKASAENRLRMKIAKQDIGKLPDIEDPARRMAAEASLRIFCETYLKHEFPLPWSDDHIYVLDTMQTCIELGGMFALALPRGSGKTTMARAAAMWAVLTGRRCYVELIAGDQKLGAGLLKAIKAIILSPECEELRADFPEALIPLARLENSPRRAAGQHINGDKTYCEWGKDRIVFPAVYGDNLPGALLDLGLDVAPAASAIIYVTSLESNVRGPQHTRMVDGRVARPDQILIDDPQTRESAKSATQVVERLRIINGDVLGQAGPGQKPAVFMSMTVVYENDVAHQMLDRQKNPQWQGHRMEMIKSFPKNEKLWDEYHKVRDDSFRQGRRGIDAINLYKAKQVEMDEGSEVSWIYRKNQDDVSAIQHAMDLMFDVGKEAFMNEYQNKPTDILGLNEGFAKPELILSRTNGRIRRSVPLNCEKVTAFIDVHKEIHFWCAVAWEADGTGYIIDYGTHPDQARHYFTLDDPPHPMSKAYPNMGENGAIQAGLEELLRSLLGRQWAIGEGVRGTDKILVDMGYKPDIVAAVKVKLREAASIIELSKGVGIRAGTKPIAMLRRQPGMQIGHHWYRPSIIKTKEYSHVCLDVNYWKSEVHKGFLTAPGDPGSLTIFGDNPSEHYLFANHIGASETFDITFGHGRQVCEWKLRPEKPDNHLFDALVGCYGGAAIAGIFGKEGRSGGRRHYSAADLRRAR